jgi:DNA gyrase/topoisomerase IV subunit A
VRLVFEPKSKNQDQTEFMLMLLAHTSLETSAPINLVMIGGDGRPRQKGLTEILQEWIDYRFVTVRRRTEFKLGKVNDRIHILEGRETVLLNIDEVIAIIRNSDEPKAALIERSACPTARPRTSSRSACASWRAWRRSRSSRSWPSCAARRKSWKTSSTTRRP